jgi:cell division ATPase FtsA
MLFSISLTRCLEMTTTCTLKKVVNKAINSCNSNFDSVVVNISDPNIRVFNLFPDTHVSSGKVKKSNVEAVIKNVESRKFRETEKCISRITHHYTLDKDLETNQGVVVKQPIGKNASTLEASVHVLTCA